MMMHYTLGQLAEHFSLALENCDDPERKITGLASLEKAESTQVSFLSNIAYKKFLLATHAGAVILSATHYQQLAPIKIPVLIAPMPYLAYAKIAQLFNHRPKSPTGVHTTAIIGQHCRIHPTASIGAHCVIGDDCEIGENTVIFPNVVLYDNVILGKNSIIHSGAILGADGFGNVREGVKWLKIPQLGRVVIGNDVEIGANTTIDRGALEDTVIEEGVKLDNQIQIAHNVRIGAYTAIAACTGIAGSTQIGKYCLIGGAVGINGHIDICDHVVITGMSSVTKSILKPGIYSSTSAVQTVSDWRKSHARLKQLDKLFVRVKQLELALTKSEA